MKRYVKLANFGLTAFVVAGCFGKSNSQPARMIATVNERELTVPRSPQGLLAAPEASASAGDTKRALDSLVDEELLAQGALKERLEKNADVLVAIEAARQQVLARSFVERSLYSTKAISNNEAESFYNSNPVLFKDRKRFRIKDYSIASIDVDDRLLAELDKIHSLPDLGGLLDRHSVAHSAQAMEITADELPTDRLDEFARAREGDILISHPDNAKTSLMYITAIERDGSMSYDRARPLIERYLTNMRNRRAVAEYLERARIEAKVALVPNRNSESMSTGRPPNAAETRIARQFVK